MYWLNPTVHRRVVLKILWVPPQEIHVPSKERVRCLLNVLVFPPVPALSVSLNHTHVHTHTRLPLDLWVITYSFL